MLALLSRPPRRLAGWLLLLAGLLHGCAHPPALRSPAHFALRLDLHGLLAPELPPLRRFLDEVERQLPPRLKSTLAEPVEVSFARLSAAPPVLTPPCAREAAHSPDLALGQTAAGKASVALNRVLLAAILAGPVAKPQYPCGHGSLYQLAVATLAHELLHLFDRHTHLSAEAQYRHLHRFAPAGRRARARNLERGRSPDPYEFESPGESFAVHGEYFLLDPEYRCREPASYLYFERVLGYRPFPQKDCALRTIVYDGSEPLDLDPSRIHAVHYLWAGRGDGIESRFGHAMLRLIVCAPHRLLVNAECEKDLQDHVVLSFAANTHGDLQLSIWKGLVGGYRSQLFVRRFPHVVIDYTERELRDLYSFPLRLSRAELELLVRRTLEIYWTYSGPYYFFTNNCGTETLSLLQAALPTTRAASLSGLTPAGIRETLLRAGIAEPLDPAKVAESQRRGLFFPSASRTYEPAYRQLHPLLTGGAPRSLAGYLQRTTARQRQRSAANIADAQALATLYALEAMARLQHQHTIEAKLLRLYFRAARQGTHARLREKVAKVLARGELYTPWHWSSSGYGVPLATEPLSGPPSTTAGLREEIEEELQAVMSTDLAAEQAELVDSAENERQFAARLLSLLQLKKKLPPRPRGLAQ